MKKVILTGFMLSLYSICNLSLAEYQAYLPLEIAKGGRLPDGSIIIGSGNTGTNPTNPTNPNNPTNPTTPTDPGTPSDGNGTDCSYDPNGSSYVEGIAGGNVFFLSKLYNSQMVNNGTKGKFQSSQPLTEQDNQDFGVQNGVVNIYEICMNGEQPEVAGPPVMVDQWKNNTCRSGNGYNDGYNYSWSEVAGDAEYTGQQLWTAAQAGAYGNYTYVNTNTYTAPAGAVNTAYGQYQNGNSMIGKGSVYLSKGTSLISQSFTGGRTVYVYDICLHIAN